MAISYVDPVNGDDTWTGVNPTGGFPAGPWATTQFAFDTVTAGNEIRLMNTGTESPGATIDVDTNASAITTQIDVYGADSNGDRLDGSGKYTISGEGIDFLTITSYVNFKDVRITGAANCTKFSSGTPFISFDRCTLDSASARNVRSDTVNGVQSFIGCDVYGSGAQGFLGATSLSGNFHLYGCDLHDNTGDGIESRGDFTGFTIIQDCRIYDNGGYGVDALNNSYISMAGNTFYGNVSGAARFTAAHAWILDNTFVGSTGGGSGIDFVTNPAVYIGHNHYHGNTVSEWNLLGTTQNSDEFGRQTGDPLFTVVTDGSEDFTPMAGSPLIGNSVAGIADIGAVQSSGAGGARKWY